MDRASALTVGFLYPGLGVAEDDLYWFVERLFPDGSLRAAVVESPIDEDAHTVEALVELGQAWRLREGVTRLMAERPLTVMWACTSGGFVFGLDGAREQASSLAEFAGVPASSTSLAFVDALTSLGLRRVAVAATYPEPVTSCFVKLLGDAGFEVVASTSNDVMTAADAGETAVEAVERFVLSGDRPDAEAVLVPDTALHTVRRLPALEAAVGKPVLSANQVTVWQALRLAGALPVGSGEGLFARTG
jgi:maleate cis-trans isomerase